MTKTLFAGALLALALPVQAQIGIATPAFTYAQSFDSLTTSITAVPWTQNVTLPGWSLFTTALAAVTTYRAGDGTSNTGAAYSFGSTSSTEQERALGGLGSSGFTGFIALAFTNQTALTLNSFTLGFDGEQWRNGGNTTAQTMVLEYGIGASFGTVAGWTAPGGSFNFTGPIATATAAAVDGNVAGLVTNLGGTITTGWAPGDTLWLRWIEQNDPGTDHGLAIDNLSFSVTAVPEPGTYALLLAGLGVVGFLARRRRV